jgi:excisionase family DNA binding protein
MQVLHGLDEAAKMLGGISVWTLRKHISHGGITATRLGRRVFLTSEEVERIRKIGLPSLRSRTNARPGRKKISNSREMEGAND